MDGCVAAQQGSTGESGGGPPLNTDQVHTRMPGGDHSHIRTQSNIYSSKLRTAFRSLHKGK